jgi:hypothetical protein
MALQCAAIIDHAGLAWADLCSECYCACRRQPGLLLRETETSVRRRFLGSSRTSYCLPVFLYVGRGTKKINGRGKKLGAGPNGRPRNPVERQFNVFQN